MQCCNCRVEADAALCPSCRWLLHDAKYQPRTNGETEGFVDRRWQFYFHRGELSEFTADPGVRWETKRARQGW